MLTLYTALSCVAMHAVKPHWLVPGFLEFEKTNSIWKVLALVAEEVRSLSTDMMSLAMMMSHQFGTHLSQK